MAGTGCQTLTYYSQAAKGQAQVLLGQKRISGMVRDPEVPQKLKDQLKLVLELREFSRNELKMNPEGNYLKYRDLNRKYVLWVVYAAPPLSVKLKTWWYPIAGKFTSRGFFKKTDARNFADGLQKAGMDVYVGGAPAYSTLGWFDDPVLNTFVNYPETDLAELIFHELAHHHLFVNGDATFNESFATATARVGVQRWLRAKGKTEAESRYHAECKREKSFVGLVLKTRAALGKLYQTDLSIDAMRKRKASILQELKTQLLALHAKDPEYSGLARWAERPINNANLAAIAVYYRQVPVFERLLKNNDGNLEKYFAEVKSLSKLAKEERIRRMESLVREK